MAYVIAEPCIDVKDRACVEECPVDCIYLGASMAYIHPGECIDCGACEPVCPVDAIYYEDDVPAQWAHYTSANADFFVDLGSPGGAGGIGPQSFDAPQVSTDGEHVVNAPDSYEKTTVGLFELVSGGYGAGYALVAGPIPIDTALDAAMGLLFDGVVSIAKRSGSAVAQVAVDDTLLPISEVSVSALVKAAAAGRLRCQSRKLPVVSPPEAVRRTIVHRVMVECAGQPIRKTEHLYDAQAVGLVANLAPLLLRSAMKRGGIDTHVVTNSFEYASFVRLAVAGRQLEGVSIFDAEIVLPDLSRVPRALLAAFRDSHREVLTHHVTRMVDLANENVTLDDPEDRSRHWTAARKEIADNGSKLWRLARASFPGVRGDVALGIIGGSPPNLHAQRPSILERAFAFAGLELPQDDLVQIFFLTRLGSKAKG